MNALNDCAAMIQAVLSQQFNEPLISGALLVLDNVHRSVSDDAHFR